MKHKIRVGVITDALSVPAWKVKSLKKITENGAVNIAAILLPLSSGKPLSPKKSLWSWHMQLDANYFKPKRNAFKILQIDQEIGSIPQIQLNDLLAIKSASLDLLICLNEVELTDEIYDLVNLGSMHLIHGADGQSDEQLFGYWEFIKRQEVITSSLVFKSGSQDTAKIISRTWSMMPNMSMSKARDKHMWKLTSFIPRALKEISQIGSTAFLKNIQKNKPVEVIHGHENAIRPTSFSAVINLLNHLNRMVHKTIRKLLYREQWILLIDRKPELSTDFKDFKDFKKILPPKHSFWADPFLVENEGQLFLFFEELFYKTNKGHLVVMEILPDGFGPVQIVLEQPYHLSYPHIFQYEKKWYLIPESCETKTIQLYECTDFPTDWKHKTDLMENVSATDSTLFYHKNKWWLFAAIAATKGASHHDELCLFYADTPLTNEWTAHSKNPIISDVRSARPAGKLFWLDGQLIRPSQDCAKKYGHGFNLNIIEVMTETEYREKLWKHVRPDWDKKLKRTHSIAHHPGVTVIDGLIQRRRF